MIEDIFENISIDENIRKGIEKLLETKSWSEIADSLIGSVDDLNEKEAEDVEKLRKTLMEVYLKKHTETVPVNEESYASRVAADLARKLIGKDCYIYTSNMYKGARKGKVVGIEGNDAKVQLYCDNKVYLVPIVDLLDDDDEVEDQDMYGRVSNDEDENESITDLKHKGTPPAVSMNGLLDAINEGAYCDECGEEAETFPVGDFELCQKCKQKREAENINAADALRHDEAEEKFCKEHGGSDLNHFQCPKCKAEREAADALRHDENKITEELWHDGICGNCEEEKEIGPEGFCQDCLDAYPELRDEVKEARYGVKLVGGSIGDQDHEPDWFDDKEEAKAKAKRMNKRLSPGEKQYYRMRYKVVTQMGAYKGWQNESVDKEWNPVPPASHEGFVEHCSNCDEVVKEVDKDTGLCKDCFDIRFTWQEDTESCQEGNEPEHEMETGECAAPAWTRSDAEKYLAEIAPILQNAGYKGTIIGSVATEGSSNHDLDIWLAPINEEGNWEAVKEAIPMAGEDYVGEDVPHYTILSDGRSVDFHLAEEEGELEEVITDLEHKGAPLAVGFKGLMESCLKEDSDNDKMDKWVEAVKDMILDGINNDDIRDDIYEVLDYIKTNCRADSPPDKFREMERKVANWFKSRPVKEQKKEKWSKRAVITFTTNDERKWVKKTVSKYHDKLVGISIFPDEIIIDGRKEVVDEVLLKLERYAQKFPGVDVNIEEAAVATEVEVDFEQELRTYYKKKINSPLGENDWPSEESWLKFWMFKNGDIIPVTNCHYVTAANALTNTSRRNIYDTLLEEHGMLWGSVQPEENKALNIAGYKKPTSEQLRVLRGYFIKYRLKNIYAEFSPRGLGNFTKEVKSSDEFNYTLRYGLDEAVATKEDVVTYMRKYFKGEINSGLIANSWGGMETEWLKFWMFENGDYIPVDHAHMTSVLDAINDQNPDSELFANGSIRDREIIHEILEKEGGMIWGSVQKTSLNIAGHRKPTSAQIARLRGFWIKHKLDVLISSFQGSGIGSFRKGVSSSDELNYALAYGVDESVNENKSWTVEWQNLDEPHGELRTVKVKNAFDEKDAEARALASLMSDGMDMAFVEIMKVTLSESKEDDKTIYTKDDIKAAGEDEFEDMVKSVSSGKASFTEDALGAMTDADKLVLRKHWFKRVSEAELHVGATVEILHGRNKGKTGKVVDFILQSEDEAAGIEGGQVDVTIDGREIHVPTFSVKVLESKVNEGADLYCPNCGENLGKASENPTLAGCGTCGERNIKNPYGHDDEDDDEDTIKIKKANGFWHSSIDGGAWGRLTKFPDTKSAYDVMGALRKVSKYYGHSIEVVTEKAKIIAAGDVIKQWLLPDGSIIEETLADHNAGAEKIAKEQNFELVSPSSEHDYDKQLIEFAKNTGYIRLSGYPGGEEIDVDVLDAITSSQLHTIKKLAKENNSFVFIFRKPNPSISGSSFREFMEVVRKHDLVESMFEEAKVEEIDKKIAELNILVKKMEAEQKGTAKAGRGNELSNLYSKIDALEKSKAEILRTDEIKILRAVESKNEKTFREILEKYKQVETDKSYTTANGSVEIPLATLESEHGGRAQIGIDDGCYILYLVQEDGSYKNTAWIFPEAFNTLKDLPLLEGLVDEILRTDETKVSLYDGSINGPFWMDKNGELDKVEGGCHEEYLTDNYGEDMDMADFGKESGYLRVNVEGDTFYVDVLAKVTPAQMTVLRYKAKEYETFIWNFASGVEGEGWPGFNKYIDDNRDSLVIKEGLVDHAKAELTRAGLFKKSSDYEGAIGEAVMSLMEIFADQGHSGFSAGMVIELFNLLSRFQPLTELTDDPNEWNDISEMQGGKPGWQNNRKPSCFSEDNGKTYYDIDEDWNKITDPDGTVWSGGSTQEEWDNKPMHTAVHFEED